VAVNFNHFTLGLESGLEIRVFLDEDSSRGSIADIERAIKDLSGVESAQFISKEKALEEMRDSFGDGSGILEGLERDNPLPDSFRVKAAEAEDVPQLALSLEQLEGVDQVNYGQGLVEKLLAAIRWTRITGMGLVAVLGVAALMLIFTTTRMSVYARRREINIMMLLGATNWFVRTPFLLEGMILGFIGSFLAAALVGFGYISLVGHIADAMPFMQPVTDSRIILGITGGIVGLGLFMGAMGSMLSMRKHLNV